VSEPETFDAPRIALGRFPTPVTRFDALSDERVEVYVKNDGATSELYGGNKVRKLEFILADARRRGARRLVTLGAAGSHQALTLALFGREHGFDVSAVLTPQPWSAHAEQCLRIALGLGLDAHPVRSIALAPAALLSAMRTADYRVALGASSTLGTLGYLLAARELAAQIHAGIVPEPDVVVVPLGSGGTAAGLLLGLVASGLSSRVLAVSVALPAGAARVLTLGLSRRTARLAKLDVPRSVLAARFEVDAEFRGPGYGVSTAAGIRATDRAETLGLRLDPTYTAKAFAKVLDLVDTVRHSPQPMARKDMSGFGRTALSNRPRRVLYWHTLSAAALDSLLGTAVRELPPGLSSLFTQPPPSAV
jgi:1-aminocyclopropane-1-carboxylate deaminase/D-cysteine desulfhydrase-like pyridoxal-dependent ACC family enzyme